MNPCRPWRCTAGAPSRCWRYRLGNNIVFDTVSCCRATKGYDMASGLGSPIADQVVEHLHH
jgi:hypothetical protein